MEKPRNYEDRIQKLRQVQLEDEHNVHYIGKTYARETFDTASHSSPGALRRLGHEPARLWTSAQP